MSSFADRFWNKVAKGKDCWLWTAALNTGGYGQIKVAGAEIADQHLAAVDGPAKRLNVLRAEMQRAIRREFGLTEERG